MSDNILKSNFQVKRPVKVEEEIKEESPLHDYEKKAVASIGGSMVFMERKKFVWDGEEGK